MAQTEIPLSFGDGTYTFRLGLAQINQLQDKCGAGIGAIYARALKGRYMLNGTAYADGREAAFLAADLIETIRQGLIGGAGGVVDGVAVQVNPAVANKLVEAYVVARPLAESWATAAAVLIALVEGYEPPKDEPAPEAGKLAATKPGSTSKKRS